jgi:molecular chaperone DnaJ
VLIRVAEHDTFARKNDDLYTDLPLSFAQVCLGADVEVPVLGGTAKLEVPAGAQPNQMLRLRGKGMPRLRERGRGDICYRVVLEIPAKLNAKQREALEQFEAASKGQRGPLMQAFVDRMKKLLT